MKITYAIASKPRFILMREVAPEDAPNGPRSSIVGEFDTEEEALSFADSLKAMDDQPGVDVGKRWLGLEARTV